MDLEIPVTCSICKNTYVLNCMKSDYDKWQNGDYIQNALHYLSAGDRELLISKTCNTCFHEMFGSEEDYEEDEDYEEEDD
jgi:hypothetical protein